MTELVCLTAAEQIIKLAMSISVTSISNTPNKLINKGAEFFRTNSNRGLFDRRRKSAVELLEASKGEYVKSVSVLHRKQELKHPEKLHVSTRPKSIVLGAEPRSKSDLGLSPVSPTDKSVKSIEQTSPDHDIKSLSNVSECNQTGIVQESRKSFHGKLSASSMTSTPQLTTEFNGTDVEKKKPVVKPKEFLSPNAFQSLSTSVTVLVEKRCNAAVDSSGNKDIVVRRKKKPLHRSQSDLSGRWSRNSSDFSDLSSRVSRTSTEVERFFNEMGLESSVLERMRKFHVSQVNEDDIFESISSIDSAERSTCSEISNEDKGQQSKDKELAERNSVQTSIVEKNARIIKWLCSVKKARTNPEAVSQKARTNPEAVSQKARTNPEAVSQKARTNPEAVSQKQQ